MKKCAFDIGKACIALSEKSCENCNFCKTKAELTESRQKFFKRIANLPPEKSAQILETYYGVDHNW